MPIAFKEWAVTVRALAEGEQLVTLRKGGIREPNKHFEVEHDRFFLYPTFDHQRRELVRESHQPELRRALEAGEETADLEYPMVTGMRASVLDYARMMETIDDHCRHAALMSLPPTAEVYALRRWTVEEFVRQYDGLAPRPWSDRST